MQRCPDVSSPVTHAKQGMQQTWWGMGVRGSWQSSSVQAMRDVFPHHWKKLFKFLWKIFKNLPSLTFQHDGAQWCWFISIKLTYLLQIGHIQIRVRGSALGIIQCFRDCLSAINSKSSWAEQHIFRFVLISVCNVWAQMDHNSYYSFKLGSELNSFSFPSPKSRLVCLFFATSASEFTWNLISITIVICRLVYSFCISL